VFRVADGAGGIAGFGRVEIQFGQIFTYTNIGLKSVYVQ